MCLLGQSIVWFAVVTQAQSQPAIAGVVDESFCHFERGVWKEELARKHAHSSRLGRCLMELPLGIHAIEKDVDDNNDVLIAIHGFKAQGKFWYEPFQILNSDSIDLYFFRWNYLRSQSKAKALLLSEIQSLLVQRNNDSAHVTMIGHSCGGVLLSSVLNDLSTDNPIDVHLVAAPFKGLRLLRSCNVELPTTISDSINVTQWRTSKRSDIAYLFLLWDPQDVQMPWMNIVQLPRSNDGKIVGHVGSLRWVARQLTRENPQRYGDSPLMSHFR